MCRDAAQTPASTMLCNTALARKVVCPKLRQMNGRCYFFAKFSGFRAWKACNRRFRLAFFKTRSWHGRCVRLYVPPMRRILTSMLQGQTLAGGLRLECRALLLERLRIGAILGLIFIPAFVPIDYLRMPEHFGWAVMVRLPGCAILAILLPLLSTRFAEQRGEWLAALGVTTISATVLGVARFADGAGDPLYLVQATALVFLIMGTALLLPLDGRTMLMLGAIPCVM